MQVGSSIGPYRLVDEVGRGMGAVFRAEKPDGDGVRTVALKVFRVHGREGRTGGLMLWHRELDALCALEHPNVARLVDFGEAEGALYLATEFVEGMTLAEYRRAARPGLAELLDLVRQVALGLEHAHEHGVLHLDLKPDNILVSGSPPAVRIVDFGLSRFAAELRSGRPALGGTFRYMAPEVLRDDRKGAGPRADLYSLGVVLFEGLTGCSPYESSDPADMVRCKLTGAVRPLGRLLPGLPAQVEGLASRLLSVDADGRPPDAGAVARELVECIGLLAKDGRGEEALDRHVRRPRKSPLEARFIGRTHELRALRSTFEACQRGKGQIVLVAGEQGIGKSRLASEFGQVVMSSGGLFLCGRGAAVARATPYYPILVASSEFLGASGAVGLFPSAGGAGVRERLAVLVDQLAGGSGEQSLEMEVDRGRERFFNLLMTGLMGLAPPGMPLVLLLDDFHWADPASIEFVERMAHRVERLPVLVVCLFRRDLVDRLSRFGRMVSELGGAMSLVEMSPLTEDEVSELVLDAAGFSPANGAGLAEYMAKQGRGNPLTTMSVAFRLMEREVVSVTDSGVAVDRERLAQADPVLMEEGENPGPAIDSVLAGLDGAAQHLIGWASAFGEPFHPEILAEAMGLPVSEVEAMLDEARSAGVVRSVGGGRVGFSHDAFRDRAYEPLEKEERKERHQRIAEVLEARGEGRELLRIPTLAEHFSRGRDLDKAMHYSVMAGESSCRIHAHDSARRYLKAALLMLRARGSDFPGLPGFELRVRQALGDTYAATGEYEFADREYQRALEFATTEFSRADLIGRRALVCFKRGELETAVAGMEEALALLGVRFPRGRVPLLLGTAWNAAGLLAAEWMFGRSAVRGGGEADPSDRLRIALLNRLTFLFFFFSIEKTVAVHILALRRSRRVPPCAESVEALSLHGPAMCSVPAPTRALRAGFDSVATARELGQPGPLMVALFYSGVTNYFLARWGEASRDLREAMALFGRTGDVFTLELAHENLGFTLYQQGEFGLALAQFNRSLELSVDVGDQRGETVGHAFMARIHAFQGDLNRARRQMAAASTKVHALRDNSLRCGVRQSAGIVHLAGGYRKQALACLEESYSLFKEHHLVQEYVAGIGYTLVEALLGTREEFRALSPEERSTVLNRARKLLAESQKVVRCFPAHAGPAIRVRGLLELRAGRPRRACRLLKRAIRILKPLRMRYELVRAYELLAEASSPEGLEKVGALAMARNLALEVGCAANRVGCRPTSGPGGPGVLLEPLSGEGETIPVDPGTAATVLRSPAGENELLTELVEVGRFLASSLDLDKLARRSLEAAVRVTGAEVGLYCVVDRPSGDISVRLTHTSDDGGDAVPEPDHFSRSVIENALRGSAPLLVEDALLDPRFATAESVLSHQLRSVLCFPVVAGGRALAAIYLENSSGSNCFRPFHVDVVRILAAQVSVCTENGLAFARVEEMNRELEGKVEARTLELQTAGKELASRNQELSNALDDLRRTQDALVQQEKLASVGRLAAGATHEINNPLSFVQGGAYAVDRKVAQIDSLIAQSGLGSESIARLVAETRSLCRILIDGSIRIKNVVEGLWHVAHGREPKLEPHDIRQSITSTVALAESQPRPGLVFETELGEVPSIRCSPGAMDQLFLNLVLNAIDAMEGKGRICLKCWYEDGHVLASISDTGPGIPEELKSRIFEPFYSSKPPGKGAGLGLSICLGIVSRRGGTIRLQSEPGKGATFVVRIPVEVPDAATARRFQWNEPTVTG